MLVVYTSLVNGGGVMVRSPSGDIYIITLFLYHAMGFDADRFIDNGTGSQRWYWKSTLVVFLTNNKVQLLAFIHSVGMIIYPVSFGRKRQYAG